jgi:hypothetical protein
MLRFISLLFALAVFAPKALAFQEQSLCLYISVADTDDEQYIAWPHKGAWRITDVMFAPATAVAADATNVQVWTVAINAGTASTSWTTIASWTTDSDDTETAHVIGTVIDLTVTQPSTALSRGYQIRIENTNGGTGPAADGTLCVNARKVG